MKKLLLVQPTTRRTSDFHCYSGLMLKVIRSFMPDSPLKDHLKDKKAINIPSLSMMILSALTPRKDFDVEFADERIRKVDYRSSPDLVGITANTLVVNRAYEIADKFRKKGSRVVLGGMHPSVLPKEALEHADSVVIGEAEYVWHELLKDFSKGNLKEVYQAERFLDMERDYVLPDTSILQQEFYLFNTIIETSRGCPHRCSFCSGPIISGDRYRIRKPEEVIKQIVQTQSRYIFFSDDNLIGKPDHAKEILSGIKDSDKRWVGCVSTKAMEDRELTDLILESGAKMLIVGFESLSNASLDEVNKKQNKVEEYSKFIKFFQDNGVVIIACFICGFDHDSVDGIKKLEEFIQENNVLFPRLAMLTPYPGTPLYQTLQKQGRILTNSWDEYTVRDGHFVFKLNDGNNNGYDKFLRNTIHKYGMPYFIDNLRKNQEFTKSLLD